MVQAIGQNAFDVEQQKATLGWDGTTQARMTKTSGIQAARAKSYPILIALQSHLN